MKRKDEADDSKTVAMGSTRADGRNGMNVDSIMSGSPLTILPASINFEGYGRRITQPHELSHIIDPSHLIMCDGDDLRCLGTDTLTS